jgi:hypothetical protein
MTEGHPAAASRMEGGHPAAASRMKEGHPAVNFLVVSQY